MSIRKRLFISNAAMVLMPIVLFIGYFILLSSFFGDEMKNFTNDYHRGWISQTQRQDQRIFSELKKTASLDSGNLLNHVYLDSITAALKTKNAGVIIRKGDHIEYTSPIVKEISPENLPSFGNEGYNSMAWLGHNQYSIRQHDFFFNDGTEGSIFLINKSGQFAQFARRFFPLIFIGLLLIVVLTNVVLSYLMARRILKPVNQLSVAAENISRGHLDFHIQSDRNDELGKLVNAFDDMRAKLKASFEIREKYENNRKELIANISHDLKTPITSIRGYVEGIQDGVANTEDKLQRYLDTIHTKAVYMDRLIDELFLFSKLDVNSHQFHFEKVELKPFLRDYVEELKLDCSEKDVDITMDFSEPFEAISLIDPNQMIRVLNNIIYNSVKYMDKKKGLIRITAAELENIVKISICDNGPGVPEEQLSEIFQRFFRGDPSRSTDTGGSGLGLAIAAQIIQAHGGSIWAESPANVGLCISFTLGKYEGDAQ